MSKFVSRASFAGAFLIACTGLLGSLSEAQAADSKVDAYGVPAYLQTPLFSRDLGTMEISGDHLGTASEKWSSRLISRPASKSSGISTDAVTDVPAGLDIVSDTASNAHLSQVVGGNYYVYSTYDVRNAQSCGTPGTCPAYSTPGINLTFMPVATSATLYGTPFFVMTTSTGATVTQAVADSVIPTNALNSSLAEVSGLQSLQFYSESDLSGLSIAGTQTVFPYGYVVQNVSSTTSRTLPASPANNVFAGKVTFALEVPSVPNGAAMSSVHFYFEVLSDSGTRVTQSPAEENLTGDIAQYTSTLTGVSSLATPGGSVSGTTFTPYVDHYNSSAYVPECTVRTAGGGSTGKTAVYAISNNSGSGTAAATLAAVPYNVTGVATGATLYAWFCGNTSNSVSPSASTFVVSGSQSGTRVTGTWGGGGSQDLTFAPATAFYPGETVSYTLTGALTSSSKPLWVGNFTVGYSGSGLSTTTPSGSGLGGVADVPMASALVGSTVNTYASGVAAADFNNDGKLDIATTVQYLNGNTSGGVLVGLNTTTSTGGTPVFATNEKVSSGGTPYGIVTGDFNGDGYADIAATNFASSGNTVQILLNEGSVGKGVFSTSSPYFNTYSAGDVNTVAIAVGDFNSDGKLDLVVGNQGSGSANGTISVLTGNGDGTFSLGTPISLPVVTGDSSSYNSGTTKHPVTSYNYMEPTAVAVADFNGDGRPDVAVAAFGSYTGDGGLYIYLNSNGSLPTTPSYNIAAGPVYVPAAMAVGDLNQDGYPDVVVANAYSQNLTMFMNKADGTGGLGAYSTIALGTYSYGESVTLGDFNGDGKLDILTGNTSSQGGSGTTYFECSTTSSATLAEPAACTSSTNYNFLAYGGNASLFLNTTTLPSSTAAFTAKGQAAIYLPAVCGYGGKGTNTNPYYYYWCNYFSDLSQVVAGDFNGDGKLDWAAADLNFGATKDSFYTPAYYVTASPALVVSQ